MLTCPWTALDHDLVTRVKRGVERRRAEAELGDRLAGRLQDRDAVRVGRWCWTSGSRQNLADAFRRIDQEEPRQPDLAYDRHPHQWRDPQRRIHQLALVRL